jgi:membrane-bound lytic murein transglycosylase B
VGGRNFVRFILVILTLLTSTPTFAQPVESFDSFIANFRAKALAAGVSGETYDRAMAGMTPDPRCRIW